MDNRNSDGDGSSIRRNYETVKRLWWMWRTGCAPTDLIDEFGVSVTVAYRDANRLRDVYRAVIAVKTLQTAVALGMPPPRPQIVKLKSVQMWLLVMMFFRADQTISQETAEHIASVLDLSHPSQVSRLGKPARRFLYELIREFAAGVARDQATAVLGFVPDKVQDTHKKRRSGVAPRSLSPVDPIPFPDRSKLPVLRNNLGAGEGPGRTISLLPGGD